MRRLFWPLLVVMAAFFSFDFLFSAYIKYHSSNPESYGMFWGRQGWLFTHLAGGALTIALGPIQLARQRLEFVRPLHRWTGRLYILGMLIACTGAVGLLATSPAPTEIRVAFAATTLAWLSTAAVAIRAIRRRRTLLHRNWMVRNYLVTLAPVTFRLLLPLAPALGVTPSPGIIATLLWASWVMPLLAFEALVRMPGARLFESTPPEPTAR